MKSRPASNVLSLLPKPAASPPPLYLNQHSLIHSPDDLFQYNGILIRSPQTGRVRLWTLRNPDGVQAAIGRK